MFELKIYRGVMCQGNEECCKKLGGIDSSVQNWHEKFDEFWLEHSKVSKFYTLNTVTKVFNIWAKKVEKT